MFPLFRFLIYKKGRCSVYFKFNASFLFELLLTKKKKAGEKESLYGNQKHKTSRRLDIQLLLPEGIV